MKRTCCEQCGATFKPGRSSGTTEAAGYGVGHSGGRTQGTTEAAGYGASHSGDRTQGTTEAAGYGVGHSSGRTQGTTKSKGHEVSGGRPRGKKRVVDFDECIDLPTDWCHEQRFVNVDSVLLNVCGHRIAQQHTYDRKPLGTGVCYGCGHMLWTTVDGAHTFLVNKPSGISDDDAPASAYLRACAQLQRVFVH